MIVAGVPVPAALAGFICRWSLPPVVSGCPDEGDRGDVFPATPLWYAAREPGRTIHPSRLWPLLVLLAAIGTAGCASTVALDRAVVAYDTTTADSVAKQLLLNIARARHNLPIHFTAVSSIAATYRYSFTAGAGPALTGDRGWLLVPVIGGSAEENPTISIAPMQGEEFTQRLLTPFSGAAADAAPAARLRCRCAVAADGAEVRLETGDARRVTLHTNRPSDREAYTVFRRMVAHLSAIQDEHALRVEPLHFQYNWTVPAESVTPENFESIYEGFSLTLDADARTYRVSRRINGRVVSTNYDPDVLPNDERHRLHEQAELAPSNDVLIDIRAGHPGGQWPLRGRLRLRSFHEVLTFIGRGIEEEPEFDVAPDPRTPKIRENPVQTLQIAEAPHLSSDVGLTVDLRGYQYAIASESGYQWNQKAFSLLYQLFQMTVGTVEQTGPAITIAK